MKYPLTPLMVSLMALSAAASTAYADDHAGPKTRAEVITEYREAVRYGEVPLLADGSSPKDFAPGQYPQRPGAARPNTKTREEVKAELAEAIRLGEIPVDDSGNRPRDINPAAYPASKG